MRALTHEEIARKIYETSTFGTWVREEKPEWVIGGNSEMQRIARVFAIAGFELDGWRCFHCGEHFTDKSDARLHFGATLDDSPACQIKAGAEHSLLGALRKSELDCRKAWDALHLESLDAITAMRSMEGRHAEQMRIAEELGYEKGLSDGRKAERDELLYKQWADSDPVLIWSGKHGKWWGINYVGYTDRLEDAGQYTFADAHKIVERNKYSPNRICDLAGVVIPHTPHGESPHGKEILPPSMREAE